jgi:hypothetical protein
VPTVESNKKISDFHKDKPKSKQHKQNLSNSQKGSKRPWSKQNLPKDSSGKNNGMYGKSHSEETKAKIGALMSERIKGNSNPMRKVEWTEERRKSMGDRARGTKWTQEAIDARSEKLRGQTRTKLYCHSLRIDWTTDLMYLIDDNEQVIATRNVLKKFLRTCSLHSCDYYTTVTCVSVSTIFRGAVLLVAGETTLDLVR